DCAARLHVDPAMISRWLSYQEAAPAVQRAFDDGTITVKEMNSLASLPREQQDSLLQLKLSSGLSAQDVEARTRKMKKPANGAAPEHKLARIPCSLAGGIKIVLSGPDMTLDQAIEALGEALKAAKKAQAEGLTARTWTAAMRDKSGSPK